MTQVRLLGPVDVTVGGVPRPVTGLRRKAVLAVLALHRGRAVSTDRLMSIVWGDNPPPTALNTLQSNVSHLRRVLDDKRAIVARPPGYLLDLEYGASDVEAGERLIELATRSADHPGRVRGLQAALDLWRGRPLMDAAGLPWLDEQAERLSQVWLRARLALIESRLVLGEHAAVVPDLEQLTRDHPLDEQIHGRLMLALYRTGRQADALAAYHRLRRTLGDDLGLDPSQALRDLESAILRQDPGLALAAPTIEVTAAAPAPMGALRLGGPSVVGRRDEVAALHRSVLAAAGGAGGAVFLVGEAGLGKTRLATEVSRLAVDAGMRVLRGRAAAPSVQFRPLREALLSVLRRSGPPDAPELAPYRPALSRLVPEWRAERPSEADGSLIVLAEAVLRLVVQAGRPVGALLVLEDLHEADADTLAVVDYLVDNASQESLLVLASLRPDQGDALKLTRAARHRRSATVIELGRLDDLAVRQLAAGCLDVPADQVPEPVYDRLLSTSDGVPLHIEELLAGMVGDGALVRSGGGWTVAGRLPSGAPVTLAATLLGRADRLDPRTRKFLQAAALLGRQFPAPAAAAAAGLDDADLWACLREAVEAHLLVADGDTGGYAFRHALTAEALRDRPQPIERAALARRAARAVEASASSFADGWERLAGELWATAGEPRRAAELFTAAARRAAAQGAIGTQITLLERAASLVEGSGALIDAYAEAGRINDAYALGARLAGQPGPDRAADVHLRLAQVAAAAGHWTRGTFELAQVRRLRGPAGDPATSARIDVLAARLAFGDSTNERRTDAERLARRALRTAEANDQPEVAVAALEMLGRCARLRDLAEADALYERGLAVAEAHDLVSLRIGLLYHLGAHDGIRAAETGRLQEALAMANRSGAVVTALNIELELSVVRICRGEYDAARESAAHAEETAGRLRLTHGRLIALGDRVILAAHQGDEAAVAALWPRFRDLGGEENDFATAVHGFGLALLHLLHEDREQALAEFARASAHEATRPVSYLSFVPGPDLFVSVLAGRAGRAECAALAGSAHVQAGWNHQFLQLAQAVLDGREGRRDAAEAAFVRFLRRSRPYPLARHLGLRLAAPPAAEDGWGDPADWLRTAAAYFRTTAPRVARACHLLLPSERTTCA